MYITLRNNKRVSVEEKFSRRKLRTCLWLKITEKLIKKYGFKSQEELINSYEPYTQNNLIHKRKEKEYKKPTWDFSKLPEKEIGSIKVALKENDTKKLDWIRKQYHLASKCLTCSYSHKNWLIASFKTYMATV